MTHLLVQLLVDGGHVAASHRHEDLRRNRGTQVQIHGLEGNPQLPGDDRLRGLHVMVFPQGFLKTTPFGPSFMVRFLWLFPKGVL